MGKEKYLQFIASFLAVLIIAIPFYTASAYASISKISVKGSDGIEGFARQADFLSFNAQASISNDTITNEQVILGSGIKFDKCEASANSSYECALRFPGNGTESFEAALLPFTISLFKDDDTLDDSKSGNLTIDNKAPKVMLSSQPKFSSQQNVVINYEVTDFACDSPSCANKCTGVKSIEFYTLDSSFKQVIEPVKNATNYCIIKSGISIDTKTFDNGQNSIFAKATDNFNQISPETSVTFAIDKNGPSIIPNSFAIIGKGISLSTFSHGSVPVEVSVNISGTDLNFNSVVADLSALNPSQNLRSAKAACSSAQEGISTCKWSIELDPETGGLKTVIINASDTSGNKESAAISKLLSRDDKGPVIQSLSAATTIGLQSLVKPSGNIVTAVLEDATGLSPEDVFLHLDSSRIKATRCTKESGWVCVWENVNFGTSGTARMSIEADTTDILGNAVSDESYVAVTVDENTPVLISINMSPVGGTTQAFPGFFKMGDKIAVIAHLKEDNDVFATADFSNFITGASRVVGSCERVQADEHICTWLTNSINLEALDFLTLNFSDNAGNTLTAVKSLKTYGLENATLPDFWSNKVTCSPAAVDRSLGPLISQRVFCEVALEPRLLSKPVSTVSISQANCKGDTSIVQSIETFNTGAESASPVIKITLKKEDLRIDKAELTCSFNIFSKIGTATTITKNPEIENAKITLKFSNQPQGELSEEVKEKIKDAKDEAEGIWEVIGTMNKIMLWAKRVCQIIQVVYNAVAVLYSIAHILMLTDVVAQKNIAVPVLGAFVGVTPAAIAGCKGETTTRVAVAQPTNHILNKFCSFVNCKQTFLWGPQVQNWINNAPLYIGPGQYIGTKTKVEGKGLFGQKVVGSEDTTLLYAYERDALPGGFKRPVSEYMDPRHNLLVATLFACLPGIIYGLDKFRQIKCLYADCLESAVGKEGMPVTACEDLKDYATCKYVTTELFALFPWTAVFDHFFRVIKDSLSNPFSALGAAISFGCSFTCPNPEATSRLATWTACETVKLFSQIGSIGLDVRNIIDEGFTIRQDYCRRLDFDDDKDKLGKNESVSRSIFSKK